MSMVFTIYGFSSPSTPVHRSMSGPTEPFSAQARSKQALHVSSINFIVFVSDNKARYNSVMQCLLEEVYTLVRYFPCGKGRQLHGGDCQENDEFAVIELLPLYIL